MKSPDLKKLAKFLDPLLREAGEEALRIRKTGSLDIALKNKTRRANYNIVTIADKRIQEMLRTKLRIAYPGIAFDGEEGKRDTTKNPWKWYADPVDGTLIFSIGLDYFGVSVGLTYRGRSVFGMIYFPGCDEMIYAIRGQGAFLNGKRIAKLPKKNTPLLSAVTAFDFPGSGDRTFFTRNYLEKLTTNVRYSLMLGCATRSVLLLAQGKIDAYVHPGATPYDIGATWIIAEECGGVVGEIHQNRIDLSKEYIPIIFARDTSLLKKLKTLFRKE